MVLLKRQIAVPKSLKSNTKISWNKIPNINSFVKKAGYNIKITEIEKKLTDHNHDEYITTPKLNKLTAENFAARLKQANLVTKTDFDDKLKSFNQKTNSKKTKHFLVENELKDYKHLIHFKRHFEEDGTQNYLVFQPMYRYFKRVVNSDFILEWKSKGLSDESIKSPSAPHNFLNLSLNYLGTKLRVRFNGSCLKQDKITYTKRNIINIYIVYEINKNDNTSSDLALENCLFGAVSLTKNADIDNYKYSGYGIGFDGHGFFSHSSGGTGRNVIIFGVDMSSSTNIDNRKKRYLNSS